MGNIDALQNVSEAEKEQRRTTFYERLKGVADTAEKEVKERKAVAQKFETLKKEAKGSNNTAVADVASYAFAKVRRSYIWKVFDFIMEIGKTISIIFTLIGGPVALAGLISNIATKLISSAKNVYQMLKGFWKWFMGTRGVHRAENAGKLLEMSTDDSNREPGVTDLVFDLIGEKVKDQMLESNQMKQNGRVKQGDAEFTRADLKNAKLESMDTEQKTKLLQLGRAALGRATLEQMLSDLLSSK